MTNITDNDDAESDPWATGFLVVLGAMWLLVLIALSTPEAANGHGIQHATIHTMDQGGDGSQRHKSLIVTGWLLGSAMIFLFTGLLAWGSVCQAGGVPAANPVQSSPFFGRLMWFVAGGVLFEVVFGMLCYSYWTSLSAPRGDFSGPFPVAVSWMLFGVWLFPAFFIVLYVVNFHRWVLPPENAGRFANLVAECSADDSLEAVDPQGI